MDVGRCRRIYVYSNVHENRQGTRVVFLQKFVSNTTIQLAWTSKSDKIIAKDNLEGHVLRFLTF
jgi:hypothetical protein